MILVVAGHNFSNTFSESEQGENVVVTRSGGGSVVPSQQMVQFFLDNITNAAEPGVRFKPCTLHLQPCTLDLYP